MRVKHGEIATSRPKFDTTVASSSHKSEEVEYLEAIGEENTEKLMRMARPYPDFKFARGANALQIAVSAEKFKSVQVLLDAGLDASLKDMWGTSALDTAIEKKLVETVQLILSYTSDISKRIRLSSEGLHIAARFGHMETVKCLIDDGADINMPDPTLQNAPLHLAAYNGHCSVMQLLISKGANLEATEINSKTPLWRAIEGYIRYSKLCNLDAIALLLEAGANVEARSNPTTWESLLEYTVRLCEPQDKAIKATKLLLEYGARIWCSNRGKSLAVTPSRFAAAICPPTLVNEIEIRSRKAVVANGISRGRVR
ncbi:Ankyrin repeat-containing protein [Glarea lozoyensis ATCC 20868]|uniref:Ankyrin repeat-containing protein n=1 Tax=Glarea lozoyensis (strain ATCC 20868 / MF5171) TaxID=1116229 RepID=S3DHD8_GLAL2|nr:Ankyrin repeat-containing protein [Glarea lozoyensis ATCC 20868]EPE25998.1 Ankyrin repeat-containing protein [Glarea lozoyensis ATCC 20868]